jgi:hypothetical protein
MKILFNEGNQIHNFIYSSGSGTVINYGSGSGCGFLTSYSSGTGSGSTSQKVTVPTVPVPVPQHWINTCRKVPLQVFLDDDILLWCLLVYGRQDGPWMSEDKCVLGSENLEGIFECVGKRSEVERNPLI